MHAGAPKESVLADFCLLAIYLALLKSHAQINTNSVLDRKGHCYPLALRTPPGVIGIQTCFVAVRTIQI